jgi:hypothetical protein
MSLLKSLRQHSHSHLTNRQTDSNDPDDPILLLLPPS